jgi:hypothetical protein
MIAILNSNIVPLFKIKLLGNPLQPSQNQMQQTQIPTPTQTNGSQLFQFLEKALKKLQVN